MLKINRIDLLRSLSNIVFAAERKHHIQILTNVLIEVRDTLFRITTTDMELECKSNITLSEPFSEKILTCVSAKRLYDICRTTPSTDLMLDFSKQSQLVIKADGSRFVLPRLDGVDFPRFSIKEENEKEFVFQFSSFIDLIKRVSFCASNNDVRQYLLGVKFEIRDKVVTSIATDGYRLALYDKTIDSLPDGSKVDIILPKKVCTELIKLSTSFINENITIIINEVSYVSFQLGGLLIRSRLIDGNFPECRSLLPTDHPLTVTVDREELRSKLSETATMLNERFRVIIIELAKNNMQLSTNNSEIDKAEVSMDVNYSMENIKIGCNLNHISEVLQIMDSKEILISLKDPDDKILLEFPEKDSPKYIIMPSRIS